MPYRPNPLAKFRLRQISVLVASACVSPILFAQSLTPPFIFVGSPSVPESFKTGMAPQNFNKDGTFTLEDRGISGVFAYAGDPLVEYSQQNPANFYFLDPMYGVPGKIMEVFCSSKPDRSDAAKLKSGVTASNRVEWQETSYSPQFDSRGYEQSGLGSIDQCYSSPIAMRLGNNPWMYDPQPYVTNSKEILYWTVTRNPDGTGTPATSNTAALKPFFKPKLLNRFDKIKPDLLGVYSKRYQAFVSPNAGRIKIGSVLNPNTTYGVGSRIEVSEAKFGIVDVVGDDIFYTPGSAYGTAENLNADEFITISAYNTAPYAGTQTPADILPALLRSPLSIRSPRTHRPNKATRSSGSLTLRLASREMLTSQVIRSLGKETWPTRLLHRDVTSFPLPLLLKNLRLTSITRPHPTMGSSGILRWLTCSPCTFFKLEGRHAPFSPRTLLAIHMRPSSGS
jgi:hypothetical protein